MKLRNKIKLAVSLLVILTLFSVPASSCFSLNDKDYSGDISGFAKGITEISPVAYQSEKEETNKNENKDEETNTNEQKETEEMKEEVLTETPSEAETSETEIYTNKNLYIEDTLFLGNSLVVGIETVSKNKPEVLSDSSLYSFGVKNFV